MVGEREGDAIRWYDSWRELFRKTYRVVAPDTEPGLSYPDYGGSYSYIARAVLLLAVKEGLPRAEEALAVLEAMLPGQESVLARDPTWAFAP